MTKTGAATTGADTLPSGRAAGWLVAGCVGIVLGLAVGTGGIAMNRGWTMPRVAGWHVSRYDWRWVVVLAVLLLVAGVLLLGTGLGRWRRNRQARADEPALTPMPPGLGPESLAASLRMSEWAGVGGPPGPLGPTGEPGSTRPGAPEPMAAGTMPGPVPDERYGSAGAEPGMVPAGTAPADTASAGTAPVDTGSEDRAPENDTPDSDTPDNEAWHDGGAPEPVAPTGFTMPATAAGPAGPTVAEPATAEPATATAGPVTIGPALVGPEEATVELRSDQPPSVPVRGRVRGAAGAPLIEATLTLIDPAGGQVGLTRSGTEGGYELTAPGPGMYTLITRARYHQPRAAVVLVNSGPVQLDLILTGSSGLSGTVLIAGGSVGLPGATATLLDGAGDVVAASRTDSAGRYRFHELDGGGYTLAVHAPGYRPIAVPVTVPDVGDCRQDIELSGAARLAGTVHAGRDNHPLADALVVLSDRSGNRIAETITDQYGRYEFSDLPAGDYLVTATGYPAVTSWLDLAHGESHSHDVTLTHPADMPRSPAGSGWPPVTTDPAAQAAPGH